MQLQKAERKRVKLRLNISSPSGFGKTYSSLLLAYGLTGDWQKIAVIDTENNSASLYAHLGDFKTLPLSPPFSPDNYIKAIGTCESAGMEVIIIDSITHVWKGQGGLLEYQSSLGGRYQDWAKVTPLYQRWLNTILQSKSHIITTCRKKQAYTIIQENGKTKVEKQGMEDEIRENYEYEMTVSLEITNDRHMARASKDRTQLFVDKPEFMITVETGNQILGWCNSGTIEPEHNDSIITKDQLLSLIEVTTSVNELLGLYKLYPQFQESLLPQFTAKRKALEENTIIKPQILNNNGNSNGQGTYPK
ncbi:MAG: AAA family ATPase [Microcystis aeruginosa Ma_AC_P_19900807_S299]|nr:MAG: AAA family ATPase [Microcystis aeruginosa Ma_AC_P_19900807_S299]